MGMSMLVVSFAMALKPPVLEEVRCAALVAGNMVGGGILALPTATSTLGMESASAEVLGLWIANVATGCILADVACDASGSPSLRGLAEQNLGVWASRATSALLVGSNALLLAAYASEGGGVLGEPFGKPAFALLACGAMAAGSRTVEAANAVAVAVMAACLGVMLVEWLPHCAFTAHTAPSPNQVLAAAPVVGSALVFQNIVPIVAAKLGDKQRAKRAVVAGSLVPALAYVAFDASVLGRLGDDIVVRPDGLVDPLQALPDDVRHLSLLALSVFSLCAVATSFVGTALSQILELDFMDDDHAKLLALAPPLAIALAGPDDLFVPALAVCGALANPLLFGLLPLALKVAAADQDRQSQARSEEPLKKRPAFLMARVPPMQDAARLQRSTNS